MDLKEEEINKDLARGMQTYKADVKPNMVMM